MTPISSYAIAVNTLGILAPEILIILAATVMMTAGAFRQRSRNFWAAASALTLVAAMAVLFLNRNRPDLDPYSAVALNDRFSYFARLGLLLMGLVLVALAHDQVDDERAAESFGALLMLHAGAMIVAAANEMVLLFSGLELVSIPTYLLLYGPRRRSSPETLEAATKYFYLSIFSSALFLFGLAYLYGLLGVSNLKALSYVLHWRHSVLNLPLAPLGIIAVVFLVAGLGFRVAAVPFHFYAPDVYQGSPTVIAATLAWIPKAVGFVALLRVLAFTFGWPPTSSDAASVENLAVISDKAVALTLIIALITMTLGNTVALVQDNLKRLFAYSSIAHAGYLMLGVAAALRQPPGTGLGPFSGGFGVIFYLGVYALMTLGAFGVFILLSTPQRSVETVDDLDGLTWTHPLAALALSLCLFSLAGVPPLAGFLGKFWIFGSAFAASQGADARWFRLVAILGVLNAAAGAYYYLRIIVRMTFSPAPAEPLSPRPTWPKIAAVGACSILSLALGLMPTPLDVAASESASALLELKEPSPEPGPTTAAARP